MATTREIRRRIRSVGNISKITRAMQMVAAAKMRRAQERTQASRAYAESIRTMMAALANLSDLETDRYPLLQQRPSIGQAGMVIISPDKGLAGALSSNILRRSLEFVRDEAGAPVEVVAVGRKARDFFRRTQYEMAGEFTNLPDWPGIEDIRPIVNIAINDFVEGKVDSVHLVYTEFVNVLTQHPTVRQLLPIEPPDDVDTANIARDFIFEPDRATVLEALLPRYVEIQVYQAMLEAIASEWAARMVAMQSATDNANELVDELTLTYNKARQTQITAEVSEIAAGAVALG